MAALVSCSQLLCGECSIAQVEEVARLGKLVAFFVLLTFAVLAFGMNTKKLEDNKIPSLYVFAVVAITTLVAIHATTF